MWEQRSLMTVALEVALFLGREGESRVRCAVGTSPTEAPSASHCTFLAPLTPPRGFQE